MSAQKISILGQTLFFKSAILSVSAQMGLVQMGDLGIILSLIGFATITLLLYLISRNRRKYELSLNQKTAEIRKLNEKMTLKSMRNHALQTEVSRTSEQLTSHDEFKAALTHLISHDLKNAMNAIMGLSRNRDDKKMDTVKTCGDLALSMISNMLDVQRFEEQQVSLRLQHHCIRETLVAAQSQVHFLFVMKNLELKIDIPDGVLVLIDKEMMTRVFVNLLVNAVKYSKVGSAVVVRVGNVIGEGGEAFTQISVQDEGEGIAQSKLPFIFDKYWQYDTKDIGKVASAGLGLVYCKHVLEAHNGRITVSSEQGIGTRFEMFVPYVEMMAASCESQNDTLSILRDELSITDEQLELIRQHGKRLYELKVYEITKIREVINELSELNIKTTWTGELQMAVYQGNQQKYDELVEMIQ